MSGQIDNSVLERLDSAVNKITRVADSLEKTVADQLDDIIISCTEAARHLGCHKNTVSTMLRDGRLKKTTIGDSTGIRFSDILNLEE